MPKKIDYQLDDEELASIEQVIHDSKNVRVVKRATGLRLLHRGHPPAEVAAMLMVSLATVHNWHHRFHTHGIAGLEDAPKSGRPRVADEEYCRVLEEALEASPAVYGYDFAIWTIDRLREYLEAKTGKQLSRERFRALLADLDYVYRRPKRDLKRLRNKDAYAQAEALLEELKKGQGTTMLNFSLWTKQP
jgi:transposase